MRTENSAPDQPEYIYIYICYEEACQLFGTADMVIDASQAPDAVSVCMCFTRVSAKVRVTRFGSVNCSSIGPDGCSGNMFLGWHICRTKLARKLFFELQNFSRKLRKNAPKFAQDFAKYPATCQDLPETTQQGAQGQHVSSRA